MIALAVAGCGSGKDDSSGSGSSATATTATTPASTTQASTTPGGCRKVAPPKPRHPGKHRKPSKPLGPGKWSLTIATNCGSFTVALDPQQSPNAAASLVALARAKYFNNTLFHRIVPGFVIQGGDPTATGTGGPGYTTVDKPPASARYTRGVVAMAKAGNEPRGAAGSQFYVVTGADAGLQPDYAIVGRISKGLGVVEKIGQLGDANEQPTEPVVISAATVSHR